MVQVKLEQSKDTPNTYRLVVTDDSGNPCKVTVYSITYTTDTLRITLHAKCGDGKQVEELYIEL